MQPPKTSARSGPCASDENHELCVRVLNALPVHLAVLDATGAIVSVNAAWRRFAEDNGGDIHRLCEGANYLEVCRNAPVGPETEEARTAIAGIESVLSGSTAVFEMTYACHGSDERRWFLMTASALSRGDGAAISHTDITGQKLAEQRLFRRSRELAALNLLRQHTAGDTGTEDFVKDVIGQLHATVKPDYAMVFMKEGGGIRRVGAAPCGIYESMDSAPDHMVGECLCGMSIEEGKPLFSRNIREDERCTLDECRKAGFTSFGAVPLVRDGEVIGALGVAARSARDFSEQAEFLEAMAATVAAALKNAILYAEIKEQAERLREQNRDLERARDDLRKSEERYGGLLQRMQEAVFRMSLPDGAYEYMSPGARRVFGYSPEDFIKSPRFIQKILHPDSRGYIETEFQNMADGRVPSDCLYQVNGPDGEGRWIYQTNAAVYNEAGKIIAIEGCCSDVTAQKTAEAVEARVAQSQKMEAIGTLAEGIAHDFNNVLSGIIGYTEVTLDMSEPESVIHRNLSRILEAGKRAGDLVRQILTFSRRRNEPRAPMQLGLIVTEALKLMRSTLGTNIAIREEIAPEVGDVLAEPTRIHQIVMNLATNAGQAMGDRDGELTVRLRQTALTEAETAGSSVLSPGPYVVLEVGDTGPGIPADVMDHIFEPYFTTKKKSGGTGLGLSVVHGIVLDHKGEIRAFNRPGGGAMFRAYFPVVGPAEKVEKRAEKDIPTGTERVMFVDDEELLAQIGSQVLEGLGYRVTALTSSTEALSRFEGDPDGFDMLITDLTMPGLTGDRLAIKFLAIRPEIPVILVSGFHGRMSPEKAMEIGARAFIDKPLTRNDLAVTVRRVLDEAR